MKCKKIKLKNGLNVLLIESHKSPVVSVQMWVRTGSADESKGIEGISHFIEHLVFKGTESFKVGEIASLVEEAGGELNAYTSFDQTVFYVTLSNSETMTALKVVNEMTSSPIFDANEVDNEREVVIEEIKRGLDSPSRCASQLFFSTAYKKHPYGIPVIGYEKVVRKVSLQKIKDYFQGRYHPENMFLIVSGDFKENEIKKLINNEFIYDEKIKFKKVKRAKEPVQKSPRVKVQKSKFQDNFLYLAFKIPDVKHKDVPALDVLSMILGQGDSSRLVKKLRIDAPICNSIGSSAYTQKDSGIFIFSATYKQENLEKVLEGIGEEILKIKSKSNHEISDVEVEKSKLNIESDKYYSLETVDRLAQGYGSMEFYFNDAHYFDKYLSVIKKLKTENIYKVAKKWLSVKTLNLTCLTQHDKISKQTINKWLKKFQKELVLNSNEKIKNHSQVQTKNKSKTKAASKTSTSTSTSTKVPRLGNITIGVTPQPKTEILKLKNGITLCMRFQKESPMVAVKAAFCGGVRAEEPNEFGVAEMTSRSWVSSTPNYSESDIYHFFEARAASIGAFSGRNSIGLSTSFLKSFEKDCAPVFGEVLLKSTFSDEIIQREKQILLHQIESRNDKPTQLAFLKMSELMFAQHPYGKDVLGTLESAQQLNHEKIAKYWSRVANLKQLTVSIVGQFDRNFWISFFENCEQPQNYVNNKKHYLEPMPLQEMTSNTSTHIEQDKEQTHIVITYRSYSLKQKEKYTLQLINNILSGQGGRLFTELRDKNSMAYSVSPISFEGIETGYTGAYIGCSTEKTQKAIDMLKLEFQKLMSVPVSEYELTKAKKNIIGTHHTEMQKTGAMANMILFAQLYGLDTNEIYNIQELYKDITAEDLQKVAQKIFSQRETIVVVGKNKTI